ncbi:MAG: type IX secretion system membrane protein PorP/SprF [Elusimicrobiota bacterium]|nr:type IX secretion system membrane protein PorP/SprF [Elusimicrobiota bacterium]
MNKNGGKERLITAFGTAALAALLLFAAPAYAAFEDLGAGARGPGMGNAFTAVADDVYAIYYNPAGLALLERPELAASHTQHLVGLSDGSGLNTSFIGYVQPLKYGRGTIGAAMQNFSIDGSFYSERAFYLSYGRGAPESLKLYDLYWGFNLKNLRRSFGSLPEASSAYNGMTATGIPDPVLSGRSAVSVIDADFGLLYKINKNYTAGLELMHLASPNIAFSSADTDRLPLHAKLGLNYRSILSNITAQYETLTAPTGARDQRVTMAMERWFPWLLVGNIGARAALSVGSRDFRQATAGLSYRTGRICLDYGFAMPLNSIASTSGSHRLSFSIRFGPDKEDEESVKLVLAAMRSIKTGKAPEIKASARVSPAVNTAVDEHLGRARFMETEGRYPEAAEELSKALELSPEDTQLLRHQIRLNFVAVQLGRLSDYKTDAVQSALYRSALAYLGGSDKEAVDQAGYALSLRPGAGDIGNYLAQLELKTGLKSSKAGLTPDAAAKVDNLLTMAAEAVESSRYEEAVYMSEAALKQQPENLTALENLGISHFAMGSYQKSLEAWEKASKLETGRARQVMINSQINSVENIIKQQKRKVAAAAPAPKTARPEASKIDSALAQKLYREGLDLYSAGEPEKAKALFQRVLEADPGNVPATNAIKRIQRELK